MTWVPSSSRPSASAGDSWWIGTAISCEARTRSAGSPVGSAAATSSSRWVSLGSCSTRCRKLASIRAGNDPSPGSPNPPANPPAESSRGSSRSASGLPCVSASMRPRTRSSSGVVMTEASSSRAETSASLRTGRSGSPASSLSWLGSRSANRRTTDSAANRRATKASTCAEDRSSHWTSSTRQTSGRSSVASDSRLSAARATRNRSGCVPGRHPNAVASASPWGAGNRATPSSSPTQS